MTLRSPAISRDCSDMLPSRSRLQSWNPESLEPAGTSVKNSGISIHTVVRNLDDRIDAMPEARGWAGQAHTAAAGMFERATNKASAFKDYAEAFAGALHSGSTWISAARRDLLAKADAIDATELNVTDQWVVLIDPAGMSAEKAAQLQKQAEAAQGEINRLLAAVDDADSAARGRLLAVLASDGAVLGDPGQAPPRLPAPPPVDDVPDPKTDEGKQFQEVARAQDMATTVREVTHTTDPRGNEVTTYTMLDGSQQIATEYVEDLPSQMIYPTGTVRVLHLDKNGNWISDTTTTPREDGGKRTDVAWADGTHMTISQNPDGTQSGSCIAANGNEKKLPDSFFQDPIPTLTGGALSGLEVKAGKGIQGVSPHVLDGLKAGAKWGGPAMGIAQMALGIYTGDTAYEKCVAAWSGGIGLAGGFATSIAVGAIPGVGPLAAMGGNVAGGFVFGYVGKLVGNVMCGP